AQDDVGPRVLWWVWEPLVAKTLTRGQTLLPALFERDAAAQAPFPSGSAPSRFRLSQVCPVAPGVASHCRWCGLLPGVRLRGHPVPDSPVWLDAAWYGSASLRL